MGGQCSGCLRGYEGEFKTLIELKLRQSGIVVVEGAAHFLDPFYPELHLDMANMVLEGRWSFDARLALLQRIESPTTAKGIQIKPRFHAWDRSQIGIASAGSVIDAMRGTVSKLMDRFCNDWLKANPKG